MPSPTDFLLGKAKRVIIGPLQQPPEPPRPITVSNCVQLDQSAADYGGNQSGGMGQDSECNAFEKFLSRSQEDVRRFNEKLANEQTNQGQDSTRD